ncbi:methionyl-tRNA formyltransferase [Flavobacteriaceae bacterium]|nr:methionyl-tRNA formyltransferase [Flavobacteriaceae bacterium]MDB4182984.1 methionyl-tRNA formyltransferase [Flavobacteriaceae bacterium]MDC0092640.1 methionyl-tRNA formyltransferase [bacterium]MDG1394228.1 methionyl-tRNA formyltransferase [Flavobacteriaceae bacterium]
MKKEDIRIVFMGTPEFAVTILEGLLKHKYTIAGVITAPDRPAGRGQKIHESAVKVFSKTKGLTILQPTNLKEDSFLNELKNLKANLQIVVAFRMLPKVVWQMPDLGTFNLHASLLPDYRGAAPINWAIINGENETGATTFFIDEKIDTGAVILQSKIDINPSENAGELHDKLMHLGSELVLKTIKSIEDGTVKTTTQPLKETKTAYKLNKDNCKVDWNTTMDTIYNQVRGLHPYPAAWGLLSNGDDLLNIKLYEVVKHSEPHEFKAGHLMISKKAIKVAVKGGFIELINFKFPGKRQMDAVSFLNGFTFDENAKMI